MTFEGVVGDSRHRVPMETEVPPPPRPFLAVPMHPLWPQAPSSVPPARATVPPCLRATTSPSPCPCSTMSPIPEALAQHHPSRPRVCSVRGVPTAGGFPHPAPPHPTPAPGPPESLRGAGGVGGGGFDLFYSHRGKNERVKAVCNIRRAAGGARRRGPAAAPRSIAGTTCVRSQRGASRRGK